MARIPSTSQLTQSQTPLSLFASARPNAGMITDLDSVDIPPEAMTEILNGRVRLDGISRKPGSNLWTPTKPNSSPVLGVAVFKKANGSIYTLRFTPTTVHRRDVGAWTLLTTGTALTGGANNRFRTATILNEFCFTNGIDRVYKVNSTVSTYDPIAAAPKAKYITGFFNRLVVANYNTDGVNPAAAADIGWSADGDVTVFDPLANLSAGRGPLVESSSDLGDYITGIFGGTNILIVLREFSVWVATKNPVASNPFNFQEALPGIGCNASDSIQVTPAGLIWYDATTRAVWAWSPGSQPERISYGKVEKDIASNITDTTLLFSAFSKRNLEYKLCKQAQNSSVVECWIYNLSTKAWAKDEEQDLTYVSDLQYGPPTLTIDNLQGTIDQLQGTIDQLVAGSSVTTAHLRGKSNGDILEEDELQDAESSVSYPTSFVSKDFKSAVLEDYFAQLRFEYQCTKAGTLVISYSTDRGETYKTAKSINMSITKGKLVTLSKQIRARHVRWKLESSNGLWSLTDYEVHYYPGGKAKADD